MPLNVFYLFCPAYVNLTAVAVSWGAQAPSAWMAVIAGFLAISAFVASAALVIESGSMSDI